jgi:YVTN family beta-propeller protein
MGETMSSGRHARIIQTNSAGDNVHIIDPTTNTVVGVIKGIEAGHGAGAAPDGSRIYISDEAESTLDIIDAKTLAILKKVPLSGHPNNMAVSKDGRRVYVGIIQEPGGVDVIDTSTADHIRRRDDSQRVCDAGRQACGRIDCRRHINVIDAPRSSRPDAKMDPGIRPMTFNSNPMV